MKMRNIALACLVALPGAAQALTPSQIFDQVSPSIWAVGGLESGGKLFHYGSAVAIGPQKLVTNCQGTTSRFEYTAWYAPEVHRYVRVQHKTWNPSNSLIGDEVVELLEYHE
jgi:hypothetical protein